MKFNDEIVSIEILNEEEMIDIEVSGDHLFYGDGILVSNSIGIPGVCDFMAAVTRNEQMDGMGQLQWKQLKNRYRNMVYRPRFIIGCELEQQLLFDVADSEQNISDSSYEINTPKIQDKFSSPQRKPIRRTNMSDIDVGE